MDLSSYLSSAQRLDCQGRVTHTLTLLPDGTVRVQTSTATAVVDPRRRVVLSPRGFRIADELFDDAAALARDVLA